jgi:hypothetical protein
MYDPSWPALKIWSAIGQAAAALAALILLVIGVRDPDTHGQGHATARAESEALGR